MNVSAPVTIIGAYVSGSAWTDSGATTNFDGYLASQGLGSTTNPSLGYALQTGANQLTTLPWANINTISVQFSGQVSNIGLGSLALVGGTGSGATPAPAVTSFTSDGNNTYSWSLASRWATISMCWPSPRPAARLALRATPRSPTPMAPASAASSRPAQSFPSGNGLAGSTFDFFFNVLPGDGKQTGTTNAGGHHPGATAEQSSREPANYNPYVDYYGAGMISAADIAHDRRTITFTTALSPRRQHLRNRSRLGRQVSLPWHWRCRRPVAP